jgi:hypothetical protein
VNPYVSFGLAMCVVVGVSLFFTAYLAVMFNRRAKRDLLATLTPLSETLGGEVDLEEAAASGRYEGHIAEGRAANSPEGPGKIFYTSLIDGAGGSKWIYTIRRPKDMSQPIVDKFEGPEDEIGQAINQLIERELKSKMVAPGWMRVEYDPAPGHVRLTRPMVTRRDIPSPEQFKMQLELLLRLAGANRRLQVQSE